MGRETHMDDNKIVELYWERREEAIKETALKYGRLCTHIAKNINGSVGKFILIGEPCTNFDNSIDSGVQNNMMSNSLSNAKNARKKRTSTKGTSITIKESLYIPSILAIMYKIASM